jgi:hypothetical protein
MGSFTLPIGPFPRYVPTLDDDDLERQRRVKRAGENPTPTLEDMTSDEAIGRRKRFGFDEPGPAQPVRTEPSMGRAAPVVDVEHGGDSIFRRAGEAPPPNTLSVPSATAPMRATYEPEGRPPIPFDRQHVDFNQANPMDALAVQRGSATPQPFASDVDEGPATRRAREMGEVGAEPHQHGSGLGERLMHGLKLGGSAFLRSGFNPLIAAGEFAEGAIDPNAWHRYEFNRDYPRAVAAAHNEQGMQEADLQRQLQRAGVTGELPSGAPTLPYREFQQRQDALNQQKEWQRYYQGEQLKDKATGRNIQRDKLDWTKEYQGKRLEQHQQGLDNGSHQLVKGMTGDGKVGWFSVNKADSTDVVQVADAEGKPLETPDAMLEGGRNYRAAQAQAHADSRAANAQAGANQRAAMRGSSTGRMTRAQAETQAAKALGADEHGLIDNPQWKDAYDHAYAVFDYEKDDAKRQAAAARQADRTVKAGKRIPANKHPEFHLKVQGLMGGQAGKDSNRQRAS